MQQHKCSHCRRYYESDESFEGVKPDEEIKKPVCPQCQRGIDRVLEARAIRDAKHPT